ncbi:uncharacterized protein LOC117121532 [Anneissia japonica]|uniref:uncharacterized protein LOC117121532 n=1 Tax=Anneissia japonica TaxID=1529436 RepID=UPI0014257D50|nr:uncharacterized protein LOC117121532 [Anneissia japonica]XP_033122651.1 uncharacterized protein LOC117121532 [Anneissia japonica]XP_033122652.1 uncharacterized protein LOC117121532 [Anneissia japonica]
MDGLKKKKKMKVKQKGNRTSEPQMLQDDVRGSVISFRPRSATDYELMHELKTSEQMANIASGLINKRLLIQKQVNLSPQIVDEIFRALEEVAECDNSIVVHFIKEFQLSENTWQNKDDSNLDVPVIKLLLDLLQFSLEPIEHNALWVKLLSVLSQVDENMDVFINMKVAATMMGAMAAHINHREIQENGCLLLGNLARFKPTPTKKAPVRESGIQVVTHAMKKHLDGHVVQKLGCRVIANVLNTMHSVSTWVVQQDYEEEDAEKLTITSLEVIDYIKDHALPIIEKVIEIHKANLDVMKEVARVRVYFRNNDSEKKDCDSEKLYFEGDYSKEETSSVRRNGILKKYVSTGDIPNKVQSSISRRVTFSNCASVRLELLGSSSDEDDSDSEGSVENVANYSKNKCSNDKLQRFMQGNLLAQRRELELANGLTFSAQLHTTGCELATEQEVTDARQPINLDSSTLQAKAVASSSRLTHFNEYSKGEELSPGEASENPGSSVANVSEPYEQSQTSIRQSSDSKPKVPIRKSIGDAHNRPVPLVSVTYPGESEKFIPSIQVIPAEDLDEEFESSHEVYREDYYESEDNWDDNDDALNLCNLEKVEADDENNWVYVKESEEVSEEDLVDTDEEADFRMGQAESYSRFYEDSQIAGGMSQYNAKLGQCLVRGNSKFYIKNPLPDIEKLKEKDGFECSADKQFEKKLSSCIDPKEENEIDIELCEKFRADNAINEGRVEEIDFKIENIEDSQELSASADPEGINDLHVKQVGRFIIIEDDLLDDPSEPRKRKKNKEKRRSFYDNVEYVSQEPSSESSEDEKNFSEKSETESQLAEEEHNLEDDEHEEDDDKNGKGITDSTGSFLRKEKCVILAVNEIQENEEKSFVYNSKKGKEIIDEYTEIDIVEALIRGKNEEKVTEVKVPSPPSSPISDYSPAFTKLWKKASFRERYRDSELYSDADLSEVTTEDNMSLTSSFENLIAQSLDEAFKDIGESSFDVDAFGDIEMKSKSLEMNMTAAVCRRLSSVSRPPPKPRRTMYYKNGDDVRMSLERTSHLDWSQQLMMHNRDPYEFEGLIVKRSPSMPDSASLRTPFWEKSTEEPDSVTAAFACNEDIQEEESMEVSAIMQGTEAVYDICTLWVNDHCIEAIETFDKLVKRVRASSMSSTKSLYFTDLHDTSKRVQKVTDTDMFGWSGILSVFSSDENKWTLSLSALVLPVTDRLFDICSTSILDAAVELVQLLVKKYGKEVEKNHSKGVIRTKYRDECRSCYIWFSKIRFRIEDMIWKEQDQSGGIESDGLLHSSLLHSVYEVLKPFDAKS